MIDGRQWIKALAVTLIVLGGKLSIAQVLPNALQQHSEIRLPLAHPSPEAGPREQEPSLGSEQTLVLPRLMQGCWQSADKGDYSITVLEGKPPGGTFDENYKLCYLQHEGGGPFTLTLSSAEADPAHPKMHSSFESFLLRTGIAQMQIEVSADRLDISSTDGVRRFRLHHHVEYSQQSSLLFLKGEESYIADSDMTCAIQTEDRSAVECTTDDITYRNGREWFKDTSHLSFVRTADNP
jgi:hypothetical protein